MKNGDAEKLCAVILMVSVICNSTIPLIEVFGGVLFSHMDSYQSATSSDADEWSEWYIEDEDLKGTMSDAWLSKEFQSPVFYLHEAGQPVSLHSERNRNSIERQADFAYNYGNQLIEVEAILGQDGIREIYNVMEEQAENLVFSMGDIAEFESDQYYTSSAIQERLTELYGEYAYKLQIANDAFVYDHPEMFWRRQVSYQFKTRVTNNSDFSGYIYYIQCEITYVTDLTDHEIAEMSSCQDQAVEKILDELPQDEGDYAILAMMYQNFASMVEYDHSFQGKYSHEGYGALVGNETTDGKNIGQAAVCEGYAKAIKILCDQIGIPCALVNGEGIVGTVPAVHMWNYVRLNNTWYALDSTWDDMGDRTEYQYFLCGSNSLNANGRSFSESHVENPSFSDGGWNFTYPKLQAEAYEPDGIRLERLQLTEEKLELILGETRQLIVECDPEDATTPLFWTSSNQNIVLVNTEGCITAVGIGKGQVTINAVNGLSACCQIQVSLSKEDQQKAFVDKLYKNLLGRRPSSRELNVWYLRIQEGMSGAELVRRFTASEEFSSQNNTDEFCVKTVYQMLVDTVSLSTGVEQYLEYLQNGVSKWYVLKTMMENEAFQIFCEESSVTAGSIELIEPRDQSYKTTAYVSRCFQTILMRSAREEELNAWSGRLLKRVSGGAELIATLMSCEEYGKESHIESEVIEQLYRGMLGRPGDKDGKEHWQHILEEGVSRRYIINKIASSSEFQRICEECDMMAGTVLMTENRDYDIRYTQYVNWHYQKVLRRKADIKGMNDWTGRIIRGDITLTGVTEAIVFSREGIQKNMDDSTFVKMLYWTCMKRASGAAEEKIWLKRLKNGLTRRHMLRDFMNSKEYKQVISAKGFV